MGVRRLALVAAPAMGESFPSWVERIAADHGVAVGRIAQLLGIPARENAGAIFRPMLYGITPTAAGEAAVKAATGVGAEHLALMHLSRYGRTLLELSALDGGGESAVPMLAVREWAQFHASRACPACLAATGGVWQLWWKLGVAAVCPVHRLLLVDVCPACGIRLRQGYRKRPRGLSKVHVSDPAGCGNHGAGGRCGQDLRLLVSEPVDGQAAAWQQQVLEVADGAPALLAGRRIDGREWFSALKSLAALVRFAAPACEAACLLPVPEVARAALIDAGAARPSVGGAHSTLRTMPANAALALAVLAAVRPILGARGEDEVAAALEPWARAAVARRRELHHSPLRHLQLPPVLQRALARVEPRNSRVAAAARAVGASVDLSAARIPHLLDAGDYRDLIAHHLPGTAPDSGRRLASLALARLAGAPSWPEAARQLDMDRRRAANVTNTLVQRIADPDAFWLDSTLAAERLKRRAPIDYAHRRSALAHLVEVPHPVLFALYRPLRLPVTNRRRQLAAWWVWVELTGGDWRDAPAYTPDERATAESMAEMYRAFRKNLPAPVAEGLTAYGTALIHKHRTGES
ncbi:TniQ family protein [Kitasatospora sp. NPDC058478]|uniref:TniQ family protein n=1 Tax=unclassified Kitasatospora TaxID=2633591 RepID=UPI00364D5069